MADQENTLTGQKDQRGVTSSTAVDGGKKNKTGNGFKKMNENDDEDVLKNGDTSATVKNIDERRNEDETKDQGTGESLGTP